MGKQKEAIRINKENNDSYVIVRTISEKVDAEAYKKIYGDIQTALDKAEEQKKEMPMQYEKRKEEIDHQISLLKLRIEAFGKHMKSVEKETAKKAKEKEAKEIVEKLSEEVVK